MADSHSHSHDSHSHSSHSHGSHSHGEDMVMRRPKKFELWNALSFLGRRRSSYDRLVKLAGIGRGDRVLDLGCGTGYLTRRAARATGSTGRVVGIDPSAEAIAYARRKSPPWCDYQVTGGDAVEGADAGFDVAVSSLAMHHVPPDRREATMAEIHRLVRPGGRLLIAEFRPPTTTLGRTVAGRLFPAMAHNAIEHLPQAITDAGFVPVAQGDVWPLLSYVVATRP
jgi:ubiquinone/menaquinone biosynthesis C-methylase UbiE